jgi:hypothetical protein
VLVITDLDVKNGDDGPANFAHFLASNRLALPPCPVARTPSGGLHLWLAMPPGTSIPGHTGILPGVDVKGDGGYVAAPPTHIMVHGIDRPGERAGGPVLLPYTWERGCPCQVPLAPPWYMQWIRLAPGTGSGSGLASGEPVPELAGLMATGILRGERNKTLHRLACSRYRRLGSGSAQVLDELRAVWLAGDQSGLSWHEVLATAESARGYIAEQECKDAQVLALASQWLERGRP